MKTKKIICLLSWFFFYTSQSFPLLFSEKAIEESLKSADLVIEGEVTDYETRAHTQFYSQFVAQVEISKVIQKKIAGPISSTINVLGLGGDHKDKGMAYSGFSRPRKFRSYEMHLRSRTDGNFEVVGFDQGLIPLQQERDFSRNRTDGSNGDGNGPHLFWKENYFPLPYYLSYPSLKNFPNFLAAIDASFQTWKNVADISVDFLPMGCTQSTDNLNDGLNQIIYISKNWAFDSSVIAITRNFYLAGDLPQSGMILDSDILLNGVNFSFTTTNESGKYDLQNILTHEIGHLLSLGHERTPVDTDATMYSVAAPNETKKRVLKASDLAGIRNAYAGTTNKTLETLSSPCQLSDSIAKSCGGVGPRKGDWLDVFILAFGLTAVWGIGHFRFPRSFPH